MLKRVAGFVVSLYFGVHVKFLSFVFWKTWKVENIGEMAVSNTDLTIQILHACDSYNLKLS